MTVLFWTFASLLVLFGIFTCCRISCAPVATTGRR